MALLASDAVWFDEDEFDSFMETVDHLKIEDGHELSGEPITLLPWQAWVYGSLLSWKKTSNGGRFMKRVAVEVGRGAGKTTASASLLLHLARVGGKSELHVIANTVPQSTIAYTAIGEWARSAFGDSRDPDASDAAEFNVTERKIAHNYTGSTITRRAAKNASLDGLKGSFLVDETSEMTGSWLKKITSALPKQRDAFLLSITTPGGQELGVDSPYYVFTRIHHEALEEEHWEEMGVGSFFFGLDPEDDFEDESVWRKGQPSLDHVIPIESYRAALLDCKASGRESDFVRFQLSTYSTLDSPWLVGDMWDRSLETVDGPGPDDAVVIGLDFSRSFDVTSGCAMWWDGKRLRAVWRHWVIRKLKGDIKRDYQRFLDDWQRRDNVVVCDHSVQYHSIREWLWDMKNTTRLRRVGYDALSGMHTELGKWGSVDEKYNPATMLPMAPVPQTVTTFGPATYLVEGMLRSGIFKPADDPVVNYSVSNVQLEENVNGDRRPSKVRSSGIIDPVVAMCMAAHVLIVEEMTEPGAYNDDAEIAV